MCASIPTTGCASARTPFGQHDELHNLAIGDVRIALPVQSHAMFPDAVLSLWLSASVLTAFDVRLAKNVNSRNLLAF